MNPHFAGGYLFVRHLTSERIMRISSVRFPEEHFMVSYGARVVRLFPRYSERGLACDEDGIALRPSSLVSCTDTTDGRTKYQVRDPQDVMRIFEAAYGAGATADIGQRIHALRSAAQALENRDPGRAVLLSLGLRLPELPQGAAARLRLLEVVLKYNPNHKPAGPGGGQFSSGPEARSQVHIADANPAIAPDDATHTSQGVPVKLPGGTTVPDDRSPTGFLMSPVADLSPVAAAGRQTGRIYLAMLNDPQSSQSASIYLALSIGINLGQGGVFDYQRSGNHITGFMQLPQFASVSNFNVGLMCQQIGLSLDETLTIAGAYAMLRSSNAKPDLPYGLDPRTAQFIVAGYMAGASGVFGRSATSQ